MIDPIADRAALGWDEKDLGRVADGSVPITPLGQRDGRYHFIARSGEHRVLDIRGMSPLGLLSLFDGNDKWLLDHFPKLDAEGNRTGQWMHRPAAQEMIALCAAVGLFSERQEVRGPGFWRHGDVAIQHCGDILIEWSDTGATPKRAGVKIGSVIYPAMPATPAAMREPGGPRTGASLLEIFKLWPWEQHDQGAELVLGWCAAALMGAVTDWHPHMLVAAKRGSGKSTLLEFIETLIGVSLSNNFSEASLRQDRASESRGFVLDETEAGGRIDRVVELLRHMASAGGARVQRGSVGGSVDHYTVTGSVFMAAINPPALEPQDASRITELGLNKLPVVSLEKRIEHEENLAKSREWIRTHAPRLRARVYSGWSRYLANLAEWRKALMRLGADARQADQLGGLLAGRDLFLSDYPTTPQEAEADAIRFEGMVRRAIVEDEEQSESALCLNHLMGSKAESWEGGVKPNIGSLVEIAIADQDGAIKAKKALADSGVKLEAARPGMIEEPYLLVANRHAQLEKIYAQTKWKGGAWARALKGLPGAQNGETSLWFGGVKSRATFIPFDNLPTLQRAKLDFWGSSVPPEDPGGSDAAEVAEAFK